MFTLRPRLYRRLLLVALVVFVAPPLRAQDPQAGALIARAQSVLAPIAKLVGTWEGEANAVIERGERLRIQQVEDITWGASRTVIMLRGTGLSTTDATRGDTVFQAAAMLWVDEVTGAPKMRTHRDGRSVDAEIEIRPDTLHWGFAVPGGRIRYTIALTDDSFHEVGDYIPERGPPMRTFEMRLRRTSR